MKFVRQAERHKIQLEKTKPDLETNSDMAEILEFGDKGFKITMIHVIRALMEKVGDL